MSEFKFACPVCGQHITADSSASGKSLECPTCFQRIIAPQAPLSGDPKLILSASKASTPTGPNTPSDQQDSKSQKAQKLTRSLAPLIILLVTGTVAFFLWHDELKGLANGLAERAIIQPLKPIEPAVFKSPHPVPTNVSWTLNVTNAPIPNSGVAGSIHGNGFLCERATFKSGRLSFRQGPMSIPDLGMTISLGVQQPEILAGTIIVVTPTNPVPAPRVALRWKDDQQQPVTEHIHSGYAMKLVFGALTGGRIRGGIFIAVPDDLKSFAAGNFEAEVIRPSQPLAGK
jgi:hypothetical protein